MPDYPLDLIPGAQAAELLGISTVSLFHWRQARKGPTAYPIRMKATTHYRYSTAEVLAYVRGRLDLDERVAQLEVSVDQLRSKVEGRA